MNVLITYPASRAQKLVDMCQQHRIFAIYQPIFSVELGADLLDLPSAMSRLNAGDNVIILSKEAFDFAWQTLADTGFAYRADLNYFVADKYLAAYVTAKTTRPVHYPDTEQCNQLLQLGKLLQLTDKKVLILCAEEQRGLFQNQLAEAKQVQYLACYYHKHIEQLTAQLSLAKRAGIDTILIENEDVLLTLYEQIAAEDCQWLVKTRLVVISQHIANIAEKLGWQSDQVIIAGQTDNQTLLNTMLTFINKAN
ncbi:hypothetical protein A6046_05995 [[Haemophilus] ducreyi]|uniref:Uroporphyrinogen-III synthase n=3 Tax=Haemophilus ducreyi TaxID=730 RepID=Q7VKW9_HAEDU|nr:uroporphyrinogen-III synthase [[Haemophilus] ducreyi]AAP96498.1 putative uroporphyrinogen III synthase [[Haemophilus] ducreyi 35000HP]AKO31357.1 hypothetical protein RY60_06680 [[Haemophilus] ducreyi]AKO32808.1 hypothetical protein RZ57_06760 [[Haemophilus] ducreyi]AKO34257.1 hypothetical protein RZ58_06750 [[Haemophilus] ducreyi]AKO35700.1 hypothetical protein RZ59_06675 [[Haemophilus] ducreyi]